MMKNMCLIDELTRGFWETSIFFWLALTQNFLVNFIWLKNRSSGINLNKKISPTIEYIYMRNFHSKAIKCSMGFTKLVNLLVSGSTVFQFLV